MAGADAFPTKKDGQLGRSTTNVVIYWCVAHVLTLMSVRHLLRAARLVSGRKSRDVDTANGFALQKRLQGRGGDGSLRRLLCYWNED